MPVQFSKAAVIAKNQTAIEACTQSIDRLDNIVGLSGSKEHKRITRRSRAVNERTNLRQVNAHLRAAGTTFKPLADSVAGELNDLGNRLDQQIRNDLIAGATIDFITSVLQDVAKIRDITDSNKA